MQHEYQSKYTSKYAIRPMVDQCSYLTLTKLWGDIRILALASIEPNNCKENLHHLQIIRSTP
jgi:hypothetical protein